MNSGGGTALAVVIDKLPIAPSLKASVSLAKRPRSLRDPFKRAARDVPDSSDVVLHVKPTRSSAALRGPLGARSRWEFIKNGSLRRSLHPEFGHEHPHVPDV